MKKFFAYFIACHCWLVSSKAQFVVTNEGWLNLSDLPNLAVPVASGSTPATSSQQLNTSSATVLSSSSSPIAETITTDIQELADGLQDDPLKIYLFVHDHIRYDHYFGAKKGAELTLLEKSGNDFDQCALLVALLRAAGYSDAGYQFGWMLLPYDNPDGSHRDIHHWLNLSLTNSNWSTTTAYLDNLSKTLRGYPITAYNWGTNIYAFQRVWATVTVSGTNYSLDPSFKISEPIPGLSNLPAAMGYTSNAFMNAAGGWTIGDPSTVYYAKGIDESSVRGSLTQYTTNLLNYIHSNCPNYSVEQVLSGTLIVAATNTSLNQGMVFQPTNWNTTMPVLSWVNEPTNMMSSLKISYMNTSYTWFMSQLLGKRLSLVVLTNGSAQLWLDDTWLTGAFTGGTNGTFNVTLDAFHPGLSSSWNTANNTFNQGTVHWTTTKGYQETNATYAISYTFNPDWGWLQKRQNILDSYLQQGLTNGSREVTSETLNVMGLNWQIQFEYMTRLINAQLGTTTCGMHRIGRMAQESGYGYYIDVYMAVDGDTSTSNQFDDHMSRWFQQAGCFGSATEHGLIEQLQITNLIGASTVKLLQLANTNQQRIYMVNSNNWAATTYVLINPNYGEANQIYHALQRGLVFIMPENGSIQLAGTGSWTGTGAMGCTPTEVQMLIADQSYTHHGGFVSDPLATVDPFFTSESAFTQPPYFDPVPFSLPQPIGADPVSMADGTFEVESKDLSLGQTEPNGLNFARYYSSSRRNSNLAGMSPGWLHSCYLKTTLVSAPRAALGGTTPAQMAPMIVAMTAANGIYSTQPNPRNWLITALIAKWEIDQITSKACSVMFGKDTLQFVLQPDGSWTPPANSTMTVSPYTVQERHGRTFKVNNLGLVTNITDQYGQSLTMSYNSSNWVKTVKDSKGRTLTFNYTGTPQKLTSVTDGTRTVTMGYSSGSQGDLTTFTDAEGKQSSFKYDSGHQITSTLDALNRVVVSNIYNTEGVVCTQYTQGDPAKMWRIFYSGWETGSQDPAGGIQWYFYDDKSRLVRQQDALGNFSQDFYDGQDHTIIKVSPLGETNQFVYDGNHNLIQQIDALGFTNQYQYDNQNNLTNSVDPIGNPTSFGYNSQFSLTGQTNGAGDWVAFQYNSDGTLHSRTDLAGQTILGYDTYGALNSITYPNLLGSETCINNQYGDVTSYTDPNGNVSTFGYNNRRELTNTIAPTNLTASVVYDAAGNVDHTVDPRGNGITNFWSATKHLLGKVMPGIPAGTPAITNFYDSRDWLSQSVDPLKQPTLFTNDLAGKLISQTDPLQRTSLAGYDNDGRKLFAANAANHTNSQTWDPRGSMLSLKDGAGHISSRVYDPAGNQIYLTNRNAKLWQFVFDRANRLTATVTPLGRSNTVTFNGQGLPGVVRDEASQYTYLYYDAKRRLTNAVDSLASTFYAYDKNGNKTSIAENGNTNRWSFDAYNRLISYQAINGYLVQYKYDANGNLTNLVYPGGRSVSYSYDALNHLTNVLDWAGRQTSMTYDLAGHITVITRPNRTFRTMGYDAAGQLTNIWEQLANGLPIAWMRLNWTNSGNASWEFAAPLPHQTTVPTRTMTYDDDNRLATFNGQNVTSDMDGNLTSAPLTNATLVAYTYDARSRLTSVGGVTNIYDAANFRLAQIVGTNATVLVIDPNAKLPQVLMRINGAVTNYYVYGPGLLYQVTETATSASTSTYHYDYRGSTIALTSDNGAISDRMEYSLYGLLTYRLGITDTPFLFNGRFGVMSDPNGLLYMQNRYYNPYLCRFINADPSGFSGGLNWYAYANGNPVSYLDPFGLGAAGEGSFSSWLDNNTYDFSPAGQFMSAYQQTQSQMQQFQSFQPDSPNGGGLSSFLNGTPFLGGAKMTAEQVFTGHDLITGESVNGLSWLSVAAIGASFIPLPLEAGAEEVAAEEGFGAGTTFTHFTDAKGIEGITGVPASSIASGDALTVGKLKFGMGSNPFMASAPGDMFMTDLSATASAGELNGIGVFGAKQSYAIQFSQETALANGVRPLLQKPGIFTIPGGTTMQGTFRIIGR